MNTPVDHNFELIRHKYSLPVYLKSQQSDVIGRILKKQNVIAVWPTGFGKSLAYLTPPLILDEINPLKSPHVALVVSPLRALMQDQLQRCKAMGIKAVAIGRNNEMTNHDKQLVESGQVSIIFASPEALKTGRWLTGMKGFRQRICLVAFDEMHCLSEWGAEFRPDYRSVASLRSIFSSAACVCLSGTVTKTVLDDVLHILQLHRQDVHVSALLPDRPNIYIDVRHAVTYTMDQLAWLADELENKELDFPKTVVFASSINTVSEIYSWLRYRLKNKAFVTSTVTNDMCMISMYHAHISNDLQQHVLEHFRQPNSVIRLLICTIAFGMGVEIGDIKRVIHWGKVQSLLVFWQEVGRCGRDGSPAHAIWYPASVAGPDHDVLKTVKKAEQCIRETILRTFSITDEDKDELQQLSMRRACSRSVKCEHCTCCSYCRSQCQCAVSEE